MVAAARVTSASRMRMALLTGALGGVIALVALHEWRGLQYWNYSEGVYALTSRLLLQGHDVYGHVVVAQPPWEFLFGAAALAIHDTLPFLRWAVGLAQLGGGLLGAVAVWRMTGSALATAATPALTLLTPWAVREHGGLTPELLAPALLLGAALLATDERRAGPAAALAACSVFLKWPNVLALVAIVALSAAPRRAAVWGLAALALQAAVFTLVFGGGLWHDALLAQLHSGRRGLGVLEGVWGQAAWNLVGLVVLAALAVHRRALARDRATLRVFTGLAVALLATLVSTTKDGTGLNVLAPVEAALVPLALTGLVLTARAGSRPALAGAVLALVFTLAQTVSLIASPRTEPPFTDPTAQRGAWGIVETQAQVEASVRAAQACPPGVAYSGPPYIAFLASRPMPDDQPDGFLPLHSPTLKPVAAAMAAVTRRCP